MVGVAVEIREGLHLERDTIMEVEKSLGKENGCSVPLAAVRSSKVQGVTVMAGGELNHNLVLPRAASGVAEGRGGVLHWFSSLGMFF